MGAHELCAVEQRQAFLALKGYGFPAVVLQNLCRRHLPALPEHFSKSQKRQTHVGQRSQIAAGAKRTLGIYHGDNVVVVEIHQALHGNRLHTRISVAQALDFQ